MAFDGQNPNTTTKVKLPTGYRFRSQTIGHWQSSPLTAAGDLVIELDVFVINSKPIGTLNNVC